MTRVYFYPVSFALFLLLNTSALNAQIWNTISFSYDKTDNPNAYKRHECGGTLLDVGGEPVGILIGGRGSRQKTIIYHPESRSVDISKDKAPYELHHVQAVTYNSTTVIAGMGFVGAFPTETPSPNILAYDYNSDSFSTIGEVPVGRQRGSAAAAIDGDWVYYFSGLTEGHTGGWVNWVDRFNIVTGDWEELMDAPRARDHSFAMKVGSKVYLLGGRNSDADGFGLHAFMVDEVDVFDLTTLSWESSPMSLPNSRAGLLAASRYNGASQLEIAVWGGETAAGALKTGDLLNIGAASSFTLPELAAPLHATVIFQLGNEDLHVIAGAYDAGNENEVTSANYAQRFGAPSTFPVEWLSVDARNEHTGVNIKWEVSEQLVNHYTIERKSPGTIWQVVGSVNSVGDGEHSYSFTDASPNQGSLVNYRILSTDYDGSISYSRVMELGVDANLFAYPNPVKANGGTIQFSVRAERLELIDGKGAVLGFAENSSSLELRSNIAPGLYYFRVFDKSQMMYARKILVE